MRNGGRLIDLTGQRFGMLLVVKKMPSKKGHTRWECRCDCGESIVVDTSALRNRINGNCGCARKKVHSLSKEDLTGMRFGKILILGPSDDKKHHWKYRCDCGREREASAWCLVRGMTSCGCWRKRDLTGQRFGMLTAIEPTGESKIPVRQETGTKRIVWRCGCDCGGQIEATTRDLLYFKVISCGCKSLKEFKLESEACPADFEVLPTNGLKPCREYVYVRVPRTVHTPKGVMLEHVYVMVKRLRRFLRDNESVHHKNGVKNDNRPENLELMISHHPTGQRVEEQKAWAMNFLRQNATIHELEDWITTLKRSSTI